jgi:flagellar hook assembly protein FlgD
VYAQRTDPLGASLWAADGDPVAIQPGSQSRIFMEITGPTTAILAWSDERSGQVDVYAHQLVASGVVTVAERAESDGLWLGAAFPNPVVATTTLRLSVPREQDVALEILDVQGRRVRRLFSERLEPGVHSISWDGRSDEARPVPSGIYYVRLTSGLASVSRKLIKLR